MCEDGCDDGGGGCSGRGVVRLRLGGSKQAARWYGVVTDSIGSPQSNLPANKATSTHNIISRFHSAVTYYLRT
jgi:hypothetical protein